MRMSDWSSDVCSSDLIDEHEADDELDDGEHRPGQRRQEEAAPFDARDIEGGGHDTVSRVKRRWVRAWPPGSDQAVRSEQTTPCGATLRRRPSGHPTPTPEDRGGGKM